jgi:hypothetical protein
MNDKGQLGQTDFDNIKFFIENESPERMTNFFMMALYFNGKNIKEQMNYLHQYRLLSLKRKI